MPEADVLPQTGVADSDGGISGWEKGSVLEHVLSGSTRQAVSWTDGFKHQVAEGVGFLPEYAGEDCFLRSVHCAAGCVCLCAEGTRQEKFLKRSGDLGIPAADRGTCKATGTYTFAGDSCGV